MSNRRLRKSEIHRRRHRREKRLKKRIIELKRKAMDAKK